MLVRAIDAVGSRLAKIRHVYAYLTGDPRRASCVRALVGVGVTLHLAIGTYLTVKGHSFIGVVTLLMSLLLWGNYEMFYKQLAKTIDAGDDALPRLAKRTLEVARQSLVMVIALLPAAGFIPMGGCWPGFAVDMIIQWVIVADGGSVRRSLAKDLRGLVAQFTPKPAYQRAFLGRSQ